MGGARNLPARQAPATTTVDIAPVLNSFTLTVAKGGVTPLTTADFGVTNAQSTDFFSLQSPPVGGVFEVTNDNGTTWVSAPTGGFTIAQIEAGDVRFHQNDTATVPDFSIWISDGSHTSLAIAPNVTLEIAVAENISFGGANGTLLLDNPSNFSGVIAGVSGASDVLDLKGFDAAHDLVVASTAGNYHSVTKTTSLVVTDETTHVSATLSLAGDYSGSTWSTTVDANGDTKVVDLTAPLTIASGATLELTSPGAPGEGVTFQGSTGMLVIDHPSSFVGIISGFTGLGTAATSDQIDLKGINHASGSFSETYDATANTLSVTDGTNVATLHFNGVYQQANFTAQSDGSGGTTIYDPPVSSDQSVGPVVVNDPGQSIGPVIMHDPGPAASSTIVASAPNQTLSGFAAADTFVFNFAGVGHDTVTNFHPATDTLQFSGTIFANAQAAMNATLDDGHGNTVVALDGHDTITLSGVLKAQLHVSDFHVV